MAHVRHGDAEELDQDEDLEDRPDDHVELHAGERRPVPRDAQHLVAERDSTPTASTTSATATKTSITRMRDVHDSSMNFSTGALSCVGLNIIPENASPDLKSSFTCAKTLASSSRGSPQLQRVEGPSP